MGFRWVAFWLMGVTAAGWLSALQPAWSAEPSPVGAEFFERKIRPLLVENCTSCHGPASRPPLGGLRVDSREALLQGGGRGAALVAGEPERSLLIRAVRYADRGLQMPPRGRLSEGQIANLAEWVRQGAPWPKPGKAAGATAAGGFDMKARARHWAFQPLRRPSLPAVKQRDWPRSPVDTFILAKLEANGLSPAPPAERRVWLRRVTYDLIGLPPTPGEIERFLADRSPNAEAKVVDRLLASPHYGERWTRHWLDLVRFAETEGHELDFEKPNAFEYRDYVIRALNADVPYHRFVTEQIAGDLLPQPRRHRTEGYNESIIGTGFWFLGENTHSPVDLRVDEAERVDNQIDVFGKTFLGLTVGCARCHDHKFEAITTEDYYALSGFLKSSRFQQAALDSPLRTPLILRNLARLDARLQPPLAEVAARLMEERAGGRDGKDRVGVGVGVGTDPPRRNPRPADLLYPRAALADDPSLSRRLEVLRQLRELRERSEQALQAGTLFEAFQSATYDGWSVTGEAFGAGPSPLPWVRVGARSERPIAGVSGPGGADSGRWSERLEGALRSATFRISKRYIWYRMSGRDADVRLVINGLQRITDPIYGSLRIHLKETSQPTWFSMEVGKWMGHRASIEILDHGAGHIAVERVVFSDEPPPAPAPNRLIVEMLADPMLTSLEALAEKYQELFTETVRLWSSGRLATAPDRAERLELLNWLLQGEPPSEEELASHLLSPELIAMLREREAVESHYPPPRRAMAMADGTPFDDRVHVRGSPRNLGEVVPRRFLEVCGGSDPRPDAGSGRLGLARQVMATPLLPRVMVNRIWQHHFGEGIVRTPDDFGIRGERPTHPELLEYLASVFVRQGWSMKKLHRMLVLSSTYRMASRAEAGAEAADPQNRLLHRMPVRRLEAEAIRDAMLAVSGRLDRKRYGPGVLPYLTPFLAGRGRPEESGPVDGDGRRSIYLNVRRNFLTPLFVAFDYPVPFSTVGRRGVSHVPAQALALMNNPIVVEQANVWARRVLAETGKTPGERVAGMYVTAFSRPPDESELAAALAFLKAQEAQYGGEDDVRSWADLGHVLFNVKEFIFVP